MEKFKFVKNFVKFMSSRHIEFMHVNDSYVPVKGLTNQQIASLIVQYIKENEKNENV